MKNSHKAMYGPQETQTAGIALRWIKFRSDSLWLIPKQQLPHIPVWAWSTCRSLVPQLGTLAVYLGFEYTLLFHLPACSLPSSMHTCIHHSDLWRGCNKDVNHWGNIFFLCFTDVATAEITRSTQVFWDRNNNKMNWKNQKRNYWSCRHVTFFSVTSIEFLWLMQ